MKNKPSASTLKIYRSLFWVGAIVYIAFWFVIKKVDSNAVDLFITRVIISSIILACLALSYTSSFFRNKIVIIAYGLAYLLSFHYIFLLILNNYSNLYSVGMMTIIFGIAVVFKENAGLLIYLLTCLAGVGMGYFFVAAPQEQPLLYMSMLVTTSVVSYLTVSIRVDVQKELRLKNKDLEKAYETINEQKKIVELKNNDITGSINYAKKIQQAIVPSKFGLEEHLIDSFIFYRVKDIVSGDFYWYYKSEDELLIASVDCTGHGVPGALMSMIGVTLLNQTVNLQSIRQPNKILNNLQKEIFTFLQRGNNDGMDIALCNLNRKKMTLSFAGAMTRIIMIRENTIREIRGDRFSISCNTSLESNFTNHAIDLHKGDTFYLFTDGYADQFGGAKQKKFMYRRLKDLFMEIHKKDVLEQKRILHVTLNEWRGASEQVDDILIIGFKI